MSERNIHVYYCVGAGHIFCGADNPISYMDVNIAGLFRVSLVFDIRGFGIFMIIRPNLQHCDWL